MIFAQRACASCRSTSFCSSAFTARSTLTDLMRSACALVACQFNSSLAASSDFFVASSWGAIRFNWSCRTVRPSRQGHCRAQAGKGAGSEVMPKASLQTSTRRHRSPLSMSATTVLRRPREPLDTDALEGLERTSSAVALELDDDVELVALSWRPERESAPCAGLLSFGRSHATSCLDP